MRTRPRWPPGRRCRPRLPGVSAGSGGDRGCRAHEPRQAYRAPRRADRGRGCGPARAVPLALGGGGLAVWRAWWRQAGVTLSALDGPGWLLAAAAATLPAGRRDWGEAMAAELAQVPVRERGARWRFAAGCARAAVFPPGGSRVAMASPGSRSGDGRGGAGHRRGSPCRAGVRADLRRGGRWAGDPGGGAVPPGRLGLAGRGDHRPGAGGRRRLYGGHRLLSGRVPRLSAGRPARDLGESPAGDGGGAGGAAGRLPVAGAAPAALAAARPACPPLRRRHGRRLGGRLRAHDLGQVSGQPPWKRRDGVLSAHRPDPGGPDRLCGGRRGRPVVPLGAVGPRLGGRAGRAAADRRLAGRGAAVVSAGSGDGPGSGRALGVGRQPGGRGLVAPGVPGGVGSAPGAVGAAAGSARARERGDPASTT